MAVPSHIMEKVKNKLVMYPHRNLLKRATAVSTEQMRSPLFGNQLLSLFEAARGIGCMSLSGPRFQWDAAIVLLKTNPHADPFEVWVNPTVHGLDDQNNPRTTDSVTPMYGMWENSISCCNLNFWIVRPQEISVEGTDEYGTPKTEVMRGLRARLFLHEMDIIRGVPLMSRVRDLDHVVCGGAMFQREQWTPGMPSAEAYETPMYHFFNFTTNQVVVPQGLEWVTSAFKTTAQAPPQIEQQ